jgi:DNA repair ATPase RecN
MLVELAITDLAIIERTTIRFEDGLNALTGENRSCLMRLGQCWGSG